MKIVIPKNENVVNNATNYVVVVDVSGSMWHSIDQLRKTLLAVNDLAGEKDTLSIAYFSQSNNFEFFVKGASIKNNNLQALVDSKIYARGATNYVQVLEKLPDILNDVKLQTGNDNFALYFLSDGYPNDGSPENRIYKVCDSLKNSFSVKTVVGYGANYNRNILLEMANKLQGNMSHVSDYIEMNKNYRTFFKGKKSKQNIKLTEQHDLIWQVTDNDVVTLTPNPDNSVDVLDTVIQSKLFGIRYDELDNLSKEILEDGAFVYSLAYLLSQKNKANLGVKLLRKAKDAFAAKMLQKSFTVSQKGRAENELKISAVHGKKISSPKKEVKTTTLSDYLKNIKSNVGKISINLKKSRYNNISKKLEEVSKVKYQTNDENATIVGVVGNENRPNVSLLTVRKGEILGVEDEDLQKRINDFNQGHDTKIEFPIESETYRNYSLVANGDFNFNELTLSDNFTIIPDIDLDLFDESDKNIKIGEFVNLNKTLIKEKAHMSVLNFYIKKYSDQKNINDIRVERYGKEGAELLSEMGLDYQMRYSPKRGSSVKDPDADYIPFLEIDTYIKGASTVSASESYKKYEAEPKKKPNVADEMMWPYFDEYEVLFNTLGKELFIETIQTKLKGVKSTVDFLSSKLANIKFYMITTNSWFDGVEKVDELIYDELVIKVKETKEYL